MGYILKKQLSNGFEAEYCRPISSPSLRFDTGFVELKIAWYKDVDARFSEKDPVYIEALMIRLTEDQRNTILKAIYSALNETEKFTQAEPRDPDPEKLVKGTEQ